MGRETVPDHPEIACAMRTGYPSWNQDVMYYCDECGDTLEGDVYEDRDHKFLCETCLLRLHKKWGVSDW